MGLLLHLEAGSLTAPANFEVHVEILVEIVFNPLPGRCPSGLALLSGPRALILSGPRALILINIRALLCCPALVFFNLALVLFDKGGKFDSPVIGDFNVWRSTSNAHGRDRGVDLHIAGLGHLAGNEGECSLG